MNKLNPSFEDAINAASLWCSAWDKGELSDEILADRVAELIKTKTGARGFFVIALASDSPVIDRLPDPLLIQIRAESKTVVDLTVKNLAMSSAMAVFHKKNSDYEQQIRSERITARCLDLLRYLDPNEVKTRLEALLNGLEGIGDDSIFLKKCGYNNEQKQAISFNINAVAYQ